MRPTSIGKSAAFPKGGPGKSLPNPVQTSARIPCATCALPSRPRRTGIYTPLAAAVCTISSLSTRTSCPTANPVAEVTFSCMSFAPIAAASVVFVSAIVSSLAPHPARPVGPEFLEAIQAVDAAALLVAADLVLPHIAQRDVELVVAHARRFRARQVGIEIRHRADEGLGMEEQALRRGRRRHAARTRGD